MTPNDTRNEALKILQEVLNSGRFIQDVADRAALVQKGASGLDVRFILNLVRGTVERKTILEAVLGKLVRTPVGKMKPLMRLIFLQGLYELLYTDGKSYAVVNEYVKLAKRRGLQGLSGFANAVLRRAADEKDSLIASLTEEEASGLPKEILAPLSEKLGRENALAFAQYVMSPASKGLTVRRNLSRCSEDAFLSALREDGSEASRTDLSAYGLQNETGVGSTLPPDEIYLLRTDRPLSELLAFREGFFYVQDVSAWSAFRSLEDVLRPETAVLDLCAAPGGKTFQLMDLAAEKGISARFTACDVSEKRLLRLKENAKRMHFTDIRVRAMDAGEHCPDLDGSFGLVIADVPCSGLGDLSGKPEIRLHVSEDELLQLSGIQGRILQNAASYVRPGGILQYSTCTLTGLENEGQIRIFLDRHPEFTLTEEKTLIPGVNTPGDGFYYARMLRESSHADQ